MGTVQGHVFPGSLFVMFGLWWMVNILYRFHCGRRRKIPFKSSATFNCPWLFWKLKFWPIEGFIKIFICTLGIILEIIASFHKGKLTHFGDGQHATMYFYFFLSGTVDVLHHYKFSMIPENLDYVSLSMAFACEGLLFRFHLHGRPDLDVLLHTLLVYVAILGALSCLLEMVHRHNVLVASLRAYSIALAGSWFIQVGWILYYPEENASRWDQSDHNQMMVATVFFTWHAAGWFVVMLILSGIFSCVGKRCCFSSGEDDNMALQKLINTNSSQETSRGLYVGIHSDDGDEMDTLDKSLH